MGRILISVALFLGVSLLALLFVPAKKPTHDPISASGLQHFGAVHGFELIDQEGKAFSLHDLDGKVWLANFIFTSCAAECPILNERVAEVKRKFEGREDVAFVSFSVDPNTDTPQRLAEYAKRYGADSRWRFLTGNEETIERLIKSSFLLPMAKTYGERSEIYDTTFIHSEKIVVVDRKGVVRYYSEGMQPESVQQLSETVRALLEET